MPAPDPQPNPRAARLTIGLTHDHVPGRGTPLNPGTRFIPLSLTLDGESLDQEVRDHPSGVPVQTRVYRDDTQSILSRNDSPDIPFTWSLNPYRGCEHGCIYCYARPGHEYLSLSCGLDFETRIMAKPDAPALLRAALGKPAWAAAVEPISMSGVTDPYQPLERSMRITRRCLEVMLECHQPVTIITKNALVLRDTDLLSRFAAWNGVHVALSITSLDAHTARVMEPRASAPADRLRAVRTLTDAGVPVSVMTAPIIPGINDHEIPSLLEAAAKAGASGAGYVLLRLPWQIKTLFLEWLTRHFPQRAGRVESLLRQTRSGDLYDATFGDRMRGTGPLADTIAQTFELFATRHGLNRRDRARLDTSRFRPPHGPDGQMGLF